MARRKKKVSYYSVGLGNKILIRAQVIFLVILVLVIASSSSAIYAGYKSGQLKRVFVEPVKSFFKALENPQATVSGQPTLEYKVNVETNFKNNSTETTVTTTIPTKSSPQQTQTKPSIQTNTPSYTFQNDTNFQDDIRKMNEKAEQAYQEALKEQQEWATQKRQEGQLWLQQQSAQDAAAAKAAYDADVQKMQQQTEEWKKAHGF